jgi:hypothetical protein
MRGAIPPLPNTPSWRAELKKAQVRLYLYLKVSNYCARISFWFASAHSKLRCLQDGERETERVIVLL